MLRSLDGAYELRDLGDGSTEVTYRLALDVSIPLIGMLKRKGEKILIDTALKGLKKRVESLAERAVRVRIILFTGKGGVGKSTVASGTAALAAAAGSPHPGAVDRRRALVGGDVRRAGGRRAEPGRGATCTCSRSTPSSGSSSPGPRSRATCSPSSTSRAWTRSRPRS